MSERRPPSHESSPAVPSAYQGPRDVGRADSLYQSAMTKPDLDYSTHLLFSALAANPEHPAAFAAVLAKIPQYAAKGRKMVVRAADLLTGAAPADTFLKSLAAYCATPSTDTALTAATEALRAGLAPHAVSLATRALDLTDSATTPPRLSALARLTDVLDAAGAVDNAVRAARLAARLFPDDQAAREREKNLLARQYIQETGITTAASSRDFLKDPAKQTALRRPTDPATRVDDLESRYRQTHALDDFRDLVRALRESGADRRESALPTLQDGHARFADRDTLFFIHEIQLDRRWSELRLQEQLLPEHPENASAVAATRAALLKDHIDHLYEIVSALPPGTPDRTRRELDLAQKLLDAGRHEEAVKQAQSVRRRPESRLDAWILMAKAFVQLGLPVEAAECFRAILAELDATAQSSPNRVLEAKYTYAQFLIAEAQKKHDPTLATQARKLCADVMIEDINYRDIRALSRAADTAATPHA